MIYNSNPKRLSLITSLLVGILLWVVIGGLEILKLTLYWKIGLGMLISIPLMYFAFYLTLEQFIYKKIKLIYKNIYSKKRGDSEIHEKLVLKGDVIENVNKEVSDWADLQQDEIDELRKMAEYRREFLGNVSHELKTPIFNIQGYILTLLDGGIDDKEVNRLYLERSEKSVNRMIAIVNDLESISSLEAGVIELRREPFDIHLLAHEIREFMEIKAGKRKVQITVAKESTDSAIMVCADMEQIRRVLINLVDNAIKYIGNTKEGVIEIKAFDMDERIWVEVEDNGIGIDEHSIPRLFERFYRVDPGRARGQGGTGLGLAIVKHIIEAHNQTIHVRSKVGVGTTFGFTLDKQK